MEARNLRGRGKGIWQPHKRVHIYELGREDDLLLASESSVSQS